MFANKATIQTKSVEVSTGNNVSTVTSGIVGRENILLNITANNLTRPHLNTAPYGSGIDTLIQAAAGDTVEITIGYANSGNVSVNSANITLMNIQ